MLATLLLAGTAIAASEPIPWGDTCADPVPITLGTTTFNTSLNTDSGYPVEGHCVYLGEFTQDLWFELTPAEDGLLTASTCSPTSFDSSLLIYQLTGPDTCSDATYLACSGDAMPDSSCQAYHAQFDVPVVGGLRYLIRVGGYDQWNNGAGILQLDLRVEDHPCQCPADIDLDLDVDVDDLLIAINGWGETGSSDGDINDSGLVDTSDLLMLLRDWGSCTTGRMLQNPFELPVTPEVVTDGIFAIWWSPPFNHDADALVMLEKFNAIRDDCLNWGMQDPPNLDWCLAYNIYVHHGQSDGWPNGWSNGQGTDGNAMPFLTLPNGLQTDSANCYHEGFHIFQYMASAPGMALNDVGWYIETSAQWYMSHNMPGTEAAFMEAGAITANPQLALWHSFGNGAPGDPEDWYYLVKQYGMHVLLHWLVDHRDIDPQMMIDCMYSDTPWRPQEHLAYTIGLETFREIFADWAAHNTGDLDYLTPAQVARARAEADWVGDPDNAHPYVADIADTDIDPGWSFRPCEDTGPGPDCLAPRGWAYNVVRIELSGPGTYVISIEGDAAGSEGAPSHFEGRLVTKTPVGHLYAPITMTSATEGTATISTSLLSEVLYIVVVSMPEHFTGNQTYGYTVTVEQESGSP